MKIEEDGNVKVNNFSHFPFMRQSLRLTMKVRKEVKHIVYSNNKKIRSQRKDFMRSIRNKRV